MVVSANPGIVASGFASSVFAAYPDDQPMTIGGVDTPAGPYVYDERQNRLVTVPRWPNNVSVAIGNGQSNDGHLEIIDMVDRVVHSFYHMVAVDGGWAAKIYMSYLLDGDGFPTPSRPYGARAAGVPSVGGILRSYEYGRSICQHPLALVPNANHMLSGPSGPATMEDANGASAYKGVAQMGSLWMLPASFDAESMSSMEMRCIARTLKKYGGRVVDTTTAPYWTIIAENISKWNNNPAPNWYADLTAMVLALRLVTAVDAFVDSNGGSFTPKDRSQKNLLSLRQMTKQSGAGVIGAYNTVRDAYVFANGQGACVVGKSIGNTWPSPQGTAQSGQPWWRWIYGNYWYSNPEPGVTYNVTATGSDASVSARLRVFQNSAEILNTGYLVPGQSAQITIPADWANSDSCALNVQRNTSTGEAWIKLEMTKV